MSHSRTFRIRDVGAYLGVSHQRAEQMFHDGKFPGPEWFDGIGPLWKPATIERWAERHLRGHAAVEEEARVKVEPGHSRRGQGRYSGLQLPP